jgi:outer membrane protein TolC
MLNSSLASVILPSLVLRVVVVAIRLLDPGAAQSALAATESRPAAGIPTPPPEAKNGLPLTLVQAVHVALQSNTDLKIEQLAPLISEAEVRKETGVFFSPHLSVEASTDRSLRPSSSILAGAQILETQNVDLNAGVAMRSLTGGVLSLDFRNKRLETNSVFQLFDPQYTAELALTLRHPLLKNFGLDLNRTRIKIARNAADISKHQLKKVVTHLITDVQQSYWDLVWANADLAASRQALDVARHMHKRSVELVAGGRLPAIAEFQTRVAVLERELDLTTSDNAWQNAQQRLKALLNLQDMAVSKNLVVVPIDQPRQPPETISLDEGLQNALAKRPEIFQAELDEVNKQLGVHFARNQTLPEVNFIGSVGLTGLSGTPTATPLSMLPIGVLPDGPFFSTDQSLSSFDGGYDVALAKLLSGEFLAYKVGLMIQVPLGNLSARSDLVRAKLEVEKAKVASQSLVQKIALEVEYVARNVMNAQKAIEGATSLRELAQRKLDLAQEGLARGVSSVTDILEAHKNVTLAQRDELRAIIEYNKLLTLWEQVTGIVLERFHITI